jgi:hypothetical protein
VFGDKCLYWGLQGYDTVYYGRLLPSFWRNAGNNLPGVYSSEMFVNTYQYKRCHKAERHDINILISESHFRTAKAFAVRPTYVKDGVKVTLHRCVK